MDLLIMFLLLSYGIMFGLANKLPWIHKKEYLEEGITDAWRTKLLTCPYCLGFHTGWLSALLLWGFFGSPALHWSAFAFGLPIAGFASSAWCYIMDTATRRLEGEADIYEEAE